MEKGEGETLPHTSSPPLSTSCWDTDTHAPRITVTTVAEPATFCLAFRTLVTRSQGTCCLESYRFLSSFLISEYTLVVLSPTLVSVKVLIMMNQKEIETN